MTRPERCRRTGGSIQRPPNEVQESAAGDCCMAEPTASPPPGRRLRDAWAAGPIMVPGVFNALVARMAERLGYPAVYLSGAALSAAAGLPDVGLLTLTEFVEQARTIA